MRVNRQMEKMKRRGVSCTFFIPLFACSVKKTKKENTQSYALTAVPVYHSKSKLSQSSFWGPGRWHLVHNVFSSLTSICLAVYHFLSCSDPVFAFCDQRKTSIYFLNLFVLFFFSLLKLWLCNNKPELTLIQLIHTNLKTQPAKHWVGAESEKQVFHIVLSLLTDF